MLQGQDSSLLLPLDDVICLHMLNSVQRIAVHIREYDNPNVPISANRLRALLPKAASHRPRDVFMPLPWEYVYDLSLAGTH